MSDDDKRHENVQWRVKTVRERRDGDIDSYRATYGKAEGERRFFALPVVDRVEEDGNLLMTAGADTLIKGLIGSAITVFSNANAFIGVGDSATAEAVGQTDLQAASNKVRQAMDSTFPTHTGGTNTVVFQATFGSGSANFVWNEFGIFNAASVGTMLNRKVSSLGTKVTGSWTLAITITLS